MTPQATTSAPADNALAVTKSDSTTYIPPLRSLWVGTGGDVAVRMAGGGEVTFENVPDGSILPVRVDRVLDATTASDIVGLL